MKCVLIVQLLTYVSLGALFLRNGDYSLGAAQILLAGVQGLLFQKALMG